MASPREFKIGKWTLGPTHRPFIVAEMSGNHNQSLSRALEIVEAAAHSGAHAIKLQTYTADTMTLNLSSGPFVIRDDKSLWNGRTLYELYQQAATPYEWHEPIMEKCRSLGIECFSSPFDESAVDFLETLNVPCYKIASFENTDIPLIRKVASTGKPIIISTGMSNLKEIQEAVDTARGCGAKDILLLKCTSTYPALPSDSNIRTIPHLADSFDVHVGLSDHTMGIGVAIASVAMGAIFIEKHFTLNRADGGVDSAFSIEPDELKNLVIETERAWLGLGRIKYSPSIQEEKSKQFRRTIRLRRDVEAGEILRSGDLAIVRPGGGLPPAFIDQLIGKRLTVSLKMGDTVEFKHLLS